MTPSRPPGGPGPERPPGADGRPPASGPSKRQQPWWQTVLVGVGMVGFIVGVAFLLATADNRPAPASYDYSTFVQKVSANQVRSVTVGTSGQLSGTLTNGTSFTSQVPTAVPDEQLLPLLRDHHVAVAASSPSTGSGLTVVVTILSLGAFGILAFWLLSRSGGVRSGTGVPGMGRAKAKLYDEQRPQTRFADVAGYEGVKAEVQEVVNFLRDPEPYRRAGAVGPKGILMVGPPGTGKTLMARAVAGEAQVPFFALTGSSFVELYVGVGASRVRDLFEGARRRAPSIVFIDEIDAIGGRRGTSLTVSDEREQTLNQLLAEMDGFDPATGVVVIAATNRPDTLDPALLRPGRFDRTVEIPLPNQVERQAILTVHVGHMTLADSVDLAAVAKSTPGFSGADLANLANEAAINAVHDGRTVVTGTDFELARDRILLGRRDGSNVLLPEEKHSVAVHEAGHALVAALAAHADPVAKVTILPAGRALGATEQLPEERHLYSVSYLRDSLMVRLGGRASETLLIGEASTGAYDDLQGATELATKMVRDWGLSPAFGPVSLTPRGDEYLGHQPIGNRQYAEDTQLTIDREVSRLLKEAERRATELLRSHRDALERLVKVLLDKETVDGREVLRILNKPAGSPAPPTLPAPPTDAGSGGGSAEPSHSR